jgi:archaeosine synthase alpha-subunit
MARRAEQLEGLAVVGGCRVGPLTFSTPTLLDARPDGSSAPGLTLRHSDGPAGVRRLRWSDGTAELELPFPVLAPEVVGPPSGPVDVGSGVVLVHGPLGSAPVPSDAGPRPELVVLGNARALWEEGEPFVRAIRQIRERFGAAPALWAPRVALPHRVPLLVYLGVDLLDTTQGLWESAEGAFLDEDLGRADAETARSERACGCAACSSDPPGALVDHTREVYRRALARARRAAREGRLRELVESRLPSEPALGEMLRYADGELGELIEERTPVTGEGTHAYVIAESHRRPEMARFRRRLLERYRPPGSKTVLLLVPCSKTKPYRASRSHRRFATALEGLRGAERVHVVSVSSPIGVVPRELEDVPPARHYDIPVTGDWSESEREFVALGVRHLLATGSYRSVVAHLDPAEYGFLTPALASGLPVRWTLTDGRTTSAAALATLASALGEALAGQPPVRGGPLEVVREELKELASVQLGRAAAERLCASPLRLAGRPWFQRLTDGRQDLATVREERGLLFLTTAGARRLGPEAPLWVEVDPSLPLTGDLFAPGVRSADPAIRVGDSVVLRRNGELAAVGEAVLPGRLMAELGRGLAVRVRHRASPPTDTPKTEELPRTPVGPVV